jgi:hypothetical protein
MHEAASHNETEPHVLRNKIVGGAMFGDPHQGGGKLMRLMPMPGLSKAVARFPSALESKIKLNCAKSWETLDPVSAEMTTCREYS